MKQKNDCQHHQDLFVESLYNELDATRQAQLTAHLEACTHCRSTFEEMQDTLQIMSRHRQTPPDWKQFEARLQEQLQAEIARPTRVWGTLGRIPQKWVLRISAAAAILLVGIFIGKYWLAPPKTASRTNEYMLETALLDRTHNYLDQSKRLFLGIANMDTVAMESGLDLTSYRQASITLVQEGRGLSAALHGSRQQRLQRLVEDLEVILLQMANLEAEGDIMEIEIIQDGLEQSGLLFKINVEALRQTLPQQTIPPQQEI